MANKLPDLQELSARLDELEAAERAPEQEPPPERRAHPRTPAYDRVPVTVEVAGGPAVQGTLRDISPGGVAVTLPVALARGQTFVFRSTIGRKSIRVACRVSNCRALASGRFVVGAKIVPPAHAADAPDAGHPLCRPPEPDQPDVDQQHLADLQRRLTAAIDSW